MNMMLWQTFIFIFFLHFVQSDESAGAANFELPPCEVTSVVEAGDASFVTVACEKSDKLTHQRHETSTVVRYHFDFIT